MFFSEWAVMKLIISGFGKLFSYKQSGQGGDGGKATVNGSGIAIGGNGGRGGDKNCGSGGKGGKAIVNGNGYAAGGEGGDSGRTDGLPAKGGRSPREILGLPN